MHFWNNKKVKKLASLRRVFAAALEEHKNHVHDNEARAFYDTESTQGIIQVLKEADFEIFLRSTLGGERDLAYAARSMQCTAKFLLWSHMQCKGTSLLPVNTLLWLKEVIKKEYKSLLSYSNHLVTQLARKPSTVKNHVLEIINCCEWYTYYAPGEARLRVEALAGIKHVSRAIQRSQRKKQKGSRVHVTMASKVKDRRMPPGGLAQLQAVVEARMTWALNTYTENIDKQTFTSFMCLLYAALYVFSVQGRQSGVMDMTYQQGWELLRRGYSNSTQFKTASKWQLQPVTLSELSMKLLAMYLRHIRPWVERTKPRRQDPLWLDFDGEAEKHIGKRVSEFFRKSLGLHITTTAIRSLVETTMDSMFRRGEISNEEKAAVHKINGHTSIVAEDYYVQQDRANDVFHARQAFTRLSNLGGSTTSANARNLSTARSDTAEDDYYGGNEDYDAAVEEEYAALPLQANSGSSSSMTVGPTANGALPLPLPLLPQLPHQDQFAAMAGQWQQHDELVEADWGTAHPDYGRTQRARWTEAEITYIGRFVDHLQATNPYTTTVMAQCLRRINADPEALPIFHAIHTLDSARLRNGYRIYMKRKHEAAQA